SGGACSICRTEGRRAIGGDGFRICEPCIAGACTRCPGLESHWDEAVAKGLGLPPDQAEAIALLFARAQRALFGAAVGSGFDRFSWENELDMGLARARGGEMDMDRYLAEFHRYAREDEARRDRAGEVELAICEA